MKKVQDNLIRVIRELRETELEKIAVYSELKEETSSESPLPTSS